MPMESTDYNISMRTNNDFMLNVNVGYDITNATPKLVVKSSRLIDWSEFISTSGTGQEFIIYIKASDIKNLGAGIYSYDCVVDFGSGSKLFVLGGKITVVEGIA